MSPASAALLRSEPAAEQQMIDVTSLQDLRDALPARENIFQIMFPTEGRTLGLPTDAAGNKRNDRDAWKMMGFEIDQMLTDRFYRLRDTRGVLSGSAMQIWVNERKPMDIVSRLAMANPETGWSLGNLGIAGSDTIDEFEQQRKAGKLDGQFARIPLERVMNTQLSRGAVCLLVPDKFNIQSLQELQDVDVTAKYFQTAKKFQKDLERNQRISIRFVREAKGGTEDDVLLFGYRQTGNKYAFGDIDFVQSGKSAVERKLRVAFMDSAKWDAIKNNELRFDELSEAEMREEKGVLFTSTGYLVRPQQQFTQAQEIVSSEITRRFKELVEGVRRTPTMIRAKEKRQGPEAFRAGQAQAYIVQGYGPHNR